jgi:hypothetical protein
MRQVPRFQLDSCDVNPALYYDEPTLCRDDGIPLGMTMLLMKKTSDDL